MMRLGFFQNKFVFVSICLYLPVLVRLDLCVITVPRDFVNWHSLAQNAAERGFLPWRDFHVCERLQDLQAPSYRQKQAIDQSKQDSKEMIKGEVLRIARAEGTIGD